MNSSLHLHERISQRGCRAEQPSPAGAWARKPANSSQLCATAQRRDRRTRSMFLEHVLCRRPLRAPWGPAFEHQHDGGPSPAVVSAAGLPCPCLRGARWSSPGGRHPFNQTGRDSADGHPILVAHSPVPSFRVEPAQAAKQFRLDSRNRAFASASLCSSNRTSQRRRRECATTSHEITTDRRAQFVPRSG